MSTGGSRTEPLFADLEPLLTAGRAPRGGPRGGGVGSRDCGDRRGVGGVRKASPNAAGLEGVFSATGTHSAQILPEETGLALGGISRSVCGLFPMLHSRNEELAWHASTEEIRLFAYVVVEVPTRAPCRPSSSPRRRRRFAASAGRRLWTTGILDRGRFAKSPRVGFVGLPPRSSARASQLLGRGAGREALSPELGEGVPSSIRHPLRSPIRKAGGSGGWLEFTEAFLQDQARHVHPIRSGHQSPLSRRVGWWELRIGGVVKDWAPPFRAPSLLICWGARPPTNRGVHWLQFRCPCAAKGATLFDRPCRCSQASLRNRGRCRFPGSSGALAWED